MRPLRLTRNTKAMRPDRPGHRFLGLCLGCRSDRSRELRQKQQPAAGGVHPAVHADGQGHVLALMAKGQARPDGKTRRRQFQHATPQAFLQPKPGRAKRYRYLKSALMYDD